MSSRCIQSQARDGTAMKEGITHASPPRRRAHVLKLMSLLGLASLCFLLGAAVIFFELPFSSFLRRAFIGGVAWFEGKKPAPPPARPVAPVRLGPLHPPEKT